MQAEVPGPSAEPGGGAPTGLGRPLPRVAEVRSGPADERPLHRLVLVYLGPFPKVERQTTLFTEHEVQAS